MNLCFVITNGFLIFRTLWHLRMYYEFFLRKKIYISFAETIKNGQFKKKKERKNEGKKNKMTSVPKIQVPLS